jgi:hypothetical protein
MRTVEQLISASRRSTGNVDFSDTAGVGDEEFLQALNDAQEEIHALINLNFPGVLMKSITQSVTANVDTYTIPADCYMGTRLDFVEYSSSGLSTDFYPLRKGAIKERINGQSGNPAFYIRRGSDYIMQPVPQNGGLVRLTYQRAIPVLDKKRATVASATLSGSAITSLVLDTATELDDAGLIEQNFITIVDKNGVVKMRYIPVTAIDGSTGVVTVTAGFTFEAGESISSGDYVVRGKYSSTHSQLPDICEKYLLEYCNMRIFVRDSSTDQAEVAALMAKIEATLKQAFAEPDSDPDRITILDPTFLGFEL